MNQLKSKAISRRPKLLLAMPLPPPYSGQEMITQMLLSSSLSDSFEIVHLDTSNKTGNVNRGRFDVRNSLLTVINFFRLLATLVSYRPEIANIPIPKNRFGFIKFSSLVLPSAWSGAKIVSRSGGGHFSEFYGNESAWMQWFIRYVLRHIDAIIVRADHQKESFRPFASEGKLWTVYLGIDAGMFDRTPTIREKHVGANVLYVGHLSKAKGAIDLLLAVPQVLSSHPHTRFRFAGDILKKERNITFIDNPDDIEADINRLTCNPDVKDSVELLGIVSGKRKLDVFANADIFVLPSYAEGFPFVVLEAMLAGKAVITTPVGALPEVFTHEKELLFVEPADVKGIGSAINRLIENRELRLGLGRAARQAVQQRFNLENLASHMEKVFHSVLEGVVR